MTTLKVSPEQCLVAPQSNICMKQVVVHHDAFIWIERVCMGLTPLPQPVGSCVIVMSVDHRQLPRSFGSSVLIGPFLPQVHPVGALRHPHQLLPLHHLFQCPDSHRTDPDLE